VPRHVSLARTADLGEAQQARAQSEPITNGSSGPALIAYTVM
jgi:hypothetical protein